MLMHLIQQSLLLIVAQFVLHLLLLVYDLLSYKLASLFPHPVFSLLSVTTLVLKYGNLIHMLVVDLVLAHICILLYLQKALLVCKEWIIQSILAHWSFGHVIQHRLTDALVHHLESRLVQWRRVLTAEAMQYSIGLNIWCDALLVLLVGRRRFLIDLSLWLIGM